MRCVVLAACVLAVSACGRSPETGPDEAPGPVVSKVAPSAETLAKLAEADRLDGKVDNIVSLCPSCEFHMPGKESFSCQVGEYLVHACRAACRDRVAEDPNELFRAIDTSGN